MDSDSAVQRVFYEVDIQQDNTDGSIPDLVTLIQAAVSDEIVELLNDTIVPELVLAMNRFVQARITSNGQALLGLLDKIDTSSGEQLIVIQDKSKLQRLNTLAKSIIDCRTQSMRLLTSFRSSHAITQQTAPLCGKHYNEI
jgi:hypothetical protein